MKYHYIYKTTCVITNNFYVGMHSTHNLKDGYIGSGKRLKYSIDKYGKEKHSCQILEFCNNREDLKKREKILVNEELILNKLCMNLKTGGEGGWDHQNNDSQIQRAKNKKGHQKQKELKSTDIEWVEKCRINKSNANKIGYVSGNRIPSGWSQSAIKNAQAPEAKAKRNQTFRDRGHSSGKKNPMFGKKHIHNIELKQSIRVNSEELDNYLSNGWKLGAVFNWQKKLNAIIAGNLKN